MFSLYTTLFRLVPGYYALLFACISRGHRNSREGLKDTSERAEKPSSDLTLRVLILAVFVRKEQRELFFSACKSINAVEIQLKL